MKLRIAIDDPKRAKSNTENDEPSREQPNTDKD
jgi:hypothetical protein